MARKFTDYERNTFMGHKLYQQITGQGDCPCEVCTRLRDEIAKGIKKIE